MIRTIKTTNIGIVPASAAFASPPDLYSPDHSSRYPSGNCYTRKMMPRCLHLDAEKGQPMQLKRSTIITLAVIFLTASCSEAQDGPVTDPLQEPTPMPTEPVVAAETTEAPDEPLRTLDDLLPAEFGGLTTEWTGDLDGMAERRIIRTLVVAGGPQFFYYQGKPRGMVTELLGLLQKELNVGLNRRLDQVEIVPMPVSRDRLIPALLSGQADLVVADLTITDARLELVDFSTPVVTNVDEIVVFAPGNGLGVAGLDDLAGQEIYVRKSSSYYEHLVALNESFLSRGLEPVLINEAHESLRAQDILEMTNAGLIGATVIDNYKASYWSELLTEMEVRNDLVVNAGGEIAWAFRKNSPQLAAVINDFARGHRVGTLIGNVLVNRYMENLQWIRNSTSESGRERLRPLLEMFQVAGKENNLDPLMLAAQAYQESELDQNRESPVGAIGIMQVKPSTAADPNVGIDDISQPADNIMAGATYMRFLMDRYFSAPEMDEVESWFFALAAYNAGPARVQRLRAQAEAEGHDPNVWIENVELIAARKIGRETVRYVRNVFKYYVAYRLSVEESDIRQSISIN